MGFGVCGKREEVIIPFFVANFHFWEPIAASQSFLGLLGFNLEKIGDRFKIGLQSTILFISFSHSLFFLWVLACVGNKRKLLDPCNEFTIFGRQKWVDRVPGLTWFWFWENWQSLQNRASIEKSHCCSYLGLGVLLHRSVPIAEDFLTCMGDGVRGGHCGMDIYEGHLSSQLQHSEAPFPWLGPIFFSPLSESFFTYVERSSIHPTSDRREEEMAMIRGILFLPFPLLLMMILHLGVYLSTASAGKPVNVTYDQRALVIDGQRRMLISAGIHYPRATAEVRRFSKLHHFIISSLEFWNCTFFLKCIT